MFWLVLLREMSSRLSEYRVICQRSSFNTFHSDWFRLETLDDSLQPTIDMLLNLSVFMWFGAVCPWTMFLNNDVIPIYRLVFLGILILLFRRVPIVYAMHLKIRQIEEQRQALFVGFFGPIGVSAVFYLYISLEFLQEITVDGVQRKDAVRLGEVMTVVIWFLAICSIVRPIQPQPWAGLICRQVVHGLSIPLGKLGFYLPRTITNALDSTSRDEPEPFHIAEHLQHGAQHIRQHHPIHSQAGRRNADQSPPRPVFRIGRSVIGERNSEAGTPHVVSPRAASPSPAPSSPSDIPLDDIDHPQIPQGNDALGYHANGSIVKETGANGGVTTSSG